jgi:hypothetical protein
MWKNLKFNAFNSRIFFNVVNLGKFKDESYRS